MWRSFARLLAIPEQLWYSLYADCLFDLVATTRKECMADSDFPVLPVVLPSNADLMVESFDHVLAGERVTDARVSDGFLGTSRQINQDTMFLDAQADRNAQYNARNIADLTRETGDGFLGTAKGQAATDRNVDVNGRYLADGQRRTDAGVNANARWLGREIDDVEDAVHSGVRHLDSEVDDVSRDVYGSTERLQSGQRHTDDVVNGNARWLGREVDDVERAVEGNAKWLNSAVGEVGESVDDGFRDTARGQRATDDRVSDGFYRSAREGDGNAKWLHAGQDANAWRLAQQAGADTRYLNSQADGNARWLDNNVDGGRRENERGFAHTNEHLSDAERRIENRIGDKVDHYGEENAEAFCDTQKYLAGKTEHASEVINAQVNDAERRLNDNIMGGSADTQLRIADTEGRIVTQAYQQDLRQVHDLDAAERRLTKNGDDAERRLTHNADQTERRLTHEVDDSERRLTKGTDDFERRSTHNLDSAERRIEQDIYRSQLRSDDKFADTNRYLSQTVNHNLEETAEVLSDFRRQTGEQIVGLRGEVRSEAERTRADGVRNELETRLYLRDREDRTHDLIRTLSDRNLVEMQAFERRSRDDEDRTRDLIRHEAELGGDRRYARGLATETQLLNKINELEGDKCCDPCGSKGRRDEDERVVQNVRINLADFVSDEAEARVRNRNRNTNVNI
jgi:hypothetical protein